MLAVAGIANPERFVASLRDAGWNVVDAMTFADHHRYSPKDLAAIEAKMQSTGADCGVHDRQGRRPLRQCARGGLPFPLYRVPLIVEFDPPAALFESVKAVLK